MQSTEVDVKLLEDSRSPMRVYQRKGDKVLAALRAISGVIAHIAAISFTAYIIYIAKPGTSLFSWHPTLMALAFSLLMVEAILVFNPESSVLLRASRKTKVRVHWILQCFAITCSFLGFFIIVLNKIQHNKDHFKSWHGLLGLITVIYMVIQTSCGVLLLYPQIAQRWNWKLIQLKVYHATFGLLGFTLACTTIALALFSNFITSSVHGFAWFLCLFCPSWCALIIMNQVTNAYLSNTRRPAPL